MPDVRLRFVGRPPGKALGPGVETVGVVGEVAEHIRDAAVLVLPSLALLYTLSQRDALK